jgi:hypothetical protein
MFHDADGSSDLLSEWRWMFGGHLRLLGWSSSGDLFVADSRGTVSHLDTGASVLEEVAASMAEFRHFLGVTERREGLLLLSVVREFEARDGPLGSEECLGFLTLPILGGTYTVENRFRLSIGEHAAVTGDLHRQLRDRPDGTRVSVKIVP